MHPAQSTGICRGFDQEYLYYCALHENQDANLKDIRKHLSTVSLLLTGVLGEFWHPKSDIGSGRFWMQTCGAGIWEGRAWPSGVSSSA